MMVQLKCVRTKKFSSLEYFVSFQYANINHYGKVIRIIIKKSEQAVKLKANIDVRFQAPKVRKPFHVFSRQVKLVPSVVANSFTVLFATLPFFAMTRFWWSDFLHCSSHFQKFQPVATSAFQHLPASSPGLFGSDPVWSRTWIDRIPNRKWSDANVSIFPEEKKFQSPIIQLGHWGYNQGDSKQNYL